MSTCKITNYMTKEALTKAVKDGKFISLKKVKEFYIDKDNNGEVVKIPVPDPKPFGMYEITGPFNKEVKNFTAVVELGVDGRIFNVK